MATLEEARDFYLNTMKCKREWLDGLYQPQLVKDYEELLESRELFNNGTAKMIREVFNDHGEWWTTECMNCVSRCTTDIPFNDKENGRVTVAYELRDLYRSNGTKANRNFRVEAIRWEGACGRVLATVKIPHDASEKVVHNRYKKLQEELNRRMEEYR